jgi:dolichyl-diphosphooligosaccharide--protein glycosyltransferase
MLRTGKIADTESVDGEPWDTHSFYPEGRSAAYEPGIVYLTVALWKVFNLSTPIDVSRVEFYLSGFMAMYTTLVVYITGCRINGRISGFVAGIVTGCAPEFVFRTLFGRFDTDIFVVLMDVLLIFFLFEMLRTDEFKKQLAFAFAFIITAIIYANCWAAKVSMLFVGLTIVGGLIYEIIITIFERNNLGIKKHIAQIISKREILLLTGTGLFVLTFIGLSLGFSVVADIFRTLSFNTTQKVSDGVLPNMYESISELTRPALAPASILDWFRGYALDSRSTVLTGIGGACVAVAAAGGIVLLFLQCIEKLGVRKNNLISRRECLLYLVILGLWTITGLYLTRSGIRFIEILTVPVGLLSGIFAGWIPRLFNHDTIKKRIAKVVTTIVVVSAIVVPDMEGFFLSVRLPSVTDASESAMKWIRENADDPNAVIEAWWDMGYYYESESGHPCLWDGGSQDAVRAILCSRAMVEKDMKMSWRILYMLACSGNAAVDLMMEYTDPETAFKTLWEVLPMDTEKTCVVLADKCSMDSKTAQKVDGLIHPAEPKEIYLVLSYAMISQTGMYEYYSDWDFSGKQDLPDEYSSSNDQEQMTKDEQEKLEAVREGYTMWRLYFDVEENPYFNCVYENYDGVEGIRVWKVAPI